MLKYIKLKLNILHVLHFKIKIMNNFPLNY